MSGPFLDFNRPITDNRPEVIAIKFSGCMKNACELMLVAMLNSSGAFWLNKYPGIEQFLKMDDIRHAYYSLMSYTPFRFLTEMRKPRNPLTKYEITKDISDLLGYLSKPTYCSMTSLEIAICEISKYDFCKSIIVYDTAMNDETKMYIANIFAGNENKVNLFTGFLKELIEKEEGITTYFVDDVEDLMSIMEYYEGMKEFDKLKEKQFFVQALSAMDKPNADSTPNFKYQNYMKDALERFGANVTWITSHFVDIRDANPHVELSDKKESDSGQNQ